MEEIHTTIQDTLSGKKIPVTIETDGVDIAIKMDGYGDACSQDGHGTPILIEFWQEELRVVVWSDINKEDPTHIINMKGAEEKRRKVLDGE